MKTTKLVSVIITTYNRKLKVLSRAVESVIHQTYKNLELIVVNDCPENVNLSTGIAQYVESLNDDRVHYISCVKNMGACKARNTGIVNSHGEYIAFLDDDDEWDIAKIEKQLVEFKNSNIGAVYCFYNNILLNGKSEKVIPCDKTGNIQDYLLKGNCVGGASVPLIRRVVFDKIGLFDEKLQSSQDHDMWLRIAVCYDFACCKEYLVNRYMQDESITMNINKQKQGFYYFIEKHKNLYINDKHTYNYILNQKAKKWIVAGYYSDAFNLVSEAIKVMPYSVSNILEPLKGFIIKVLGK